MPALPAAHATQHAVNSKRVPTLFWMNASGNRAAIAWMARHPVQCDRHEVVGRERPPARRRSADDRLEERAAEVEAADHRVEAAASPVSRRT